MLLVSFFYFVCTEIQCLRILSKGTVQISAKLTLSVTLKSTYNPPKIPLNDMVHCEGFIPEAASSFPVKASYGFSCRRGTEWKEILPRTWSRWRSLCSSLCFEGSMPPQHRTAWNDHIYMYTHHVSPYSLLFHKIQKNPHFIFCCMDNSE